MSKLKARYRALEILWAGQRPPEDLDLAVFRLFSETEGNPEKFALWRMQAMEQANATRDPEVVTAMAWIFGNRNTSTDESLNAALHRGERHFGGQA